MSDPLSDLTAEDVLQEEGMSEYARIERELFDHLVRLENNVSVLEDFIAFPGLKLLHGHRLFFDWLGQNLYEYTIVIVWRLWADTDRRSVTLKRLHQIVATHVRDEYRAALYDRLRAARPSKDIRDVLTRTEAMRHRSLAHVDEGWSFDEAQRTASVTVADLRQAADFLAMYYERLHFGIGYHFGLASFERNRGSSSLTERIMEAAVLRSPLLRIYDQVGPERWWRGPGSSLTSDEVEWLRAARRRAGLELEGRPEVG